MTDLKIAMWNIQGIRNSVHGYKLDIPEVKHNLNRHDIIGLVETHANDNIYIDFEGYVNVAQVNRAKKNTAKRYSGGLVALVKKNVSKGVSYSKSPNLNGQIIWLKLSKSFFKLQNDIYLAIVYISPQYSSLNVNDNTDFFDGLERDIIWFSQKGQVILTGDFNARTATELDYIHNDDCSYLPIHDINYTPDRPIRIRFNQDKTCQAYGKTLLNVCKSSGLRILNGRVLGDSLGKVTCHQYNGSSTVDYGIVHHTLLPYINYFKVHNWFETISDHCHISFSITVDMETCVIPQSIKMSKLKHQYKWDTESNVLFYNAMVSNEIQYRLDQICETIQLDENVNVATDRITRVLYDVADKTLRKKKVTNTCKKQKKEKWYDLDCVSLKRECKVLGKSLQDRPYDMRIRESLFSAKKRYKAMVRQKKRSYKNQILDNIQNLHSKDPSRYWKLVNELRKTRANASKTDSISPMEWYSYFKDLFAKPNYNDPVFEKWVLDEITSKEKENCFNNLNLTITESEVMKVLKSLKKGKACAADGIANELITTGASVLCKPLTILFNKIYSTESYPKQWGEGLISAIFKSGDEITLEITGE